MKIVLHKAKISDTDFFLNLRNKNRGQFINSLKITKKDHSKWFKKSLKLKRNLFFKISNKKNYKCGYLRLEKKKKSFNVSICIDSKFRNKNIAYNSLISVEDKISKNYTLFSVIKRNNIASKLLFQKAGYDIYKTNKNLIFMKKKTK